MIIHVSTLEYYTTLDALLVRVSMDDIGDPCINLGSPYHAGLSVSVDDIVGMVIHVSTLDHHTIHETPCQRICG